MRWREAKPMTRREQRLRKQIDMACKLGDRLSGQMTQAVDDRRILLGAIAFAVRLIRVGKVTDALAVLERQLDKRGHRS